MSVLHSPDGKIILCLFTSFVWLASFIHGSKLSFIQATEYKLTTLRSTSQSYRATVSALTASRLFCGRRDSLELSPAQYPGPWACSTAHRSNRPDHWDGLMLDISAVGQRTSLSSRAKWQQLPAIAAILFYWIRMKLSNS